MTANPHPDTADNTWFHPDARHVLTTTRAVRRHLDFDRDVPAQLIGECLDIAAQAPTGGAHLRAHWVVLQRGADLHDIGQIYAQTWHSRYGAVLQQTPAESLPADLVSAAYLADNFHRLPACVVAYVEADLDATANQASVFGSVLPAAWSFALACRGKGLATAWTTTLLAREADIAELLGVPPGYRLAVALPVAYPTTQQFRPARRPGIAEHIHWGRWNHTQPDR